MKTQSIKISALILAALFIIPSISFGQNNKTAEPNAEMIYNRTNNLINQKLKSGFKLYDPESNRTINLVKMTAIREVKCALGDNQYYNCAVFHAADSNSYDIDFFFDWKKDSLYTKHIILHKTNSKPRWVWYENKKTHIWKPLETCGIDNSITWGKPTDPKVTDGAAHVVFDKNGKAKYIWYMDNNTNKWTALKICDKEDPKITSLYK